MIKEQVLEKCRKLKALAGSSNPHEAKLALTRMQAILAKNGLEESDLEKNEFGQLFFEYHGGPWARHIVGGIAALYFCKVMYRPSRSNKAIYTLVGTPTNTAFVKELSLDILQRVHYAARRVALYNNEITSFRNGAAMEIAFKCSALIKAAKDSGKIEDSDENGTALVLGDYYQRNEKAIDKWMKENIGPTRPGRTRASKVDPASYQKGLLYGSTVELQKKVS